MTTGNNTPTPWRRKFIMEDEAPVAVRLDVPSEAVLTAEIAWS